MITVPPAPPAPPGNVIPNAEGNRTTPSVVAYTANGEALVGQLAKRQSVVNPENTFYSVKRFIGSKENEISADDKQVPYKVIKDQNGNIKIKCSNVTINMVMRHPCLLMLGS